MAPKYDLPAGHLGCQKLPGTRAVPPPRCAPALLCAPADRLANDVSKGVLEDVRKLKHAVGKAQARVQRIRTELEEILDDDADMQAGARPPPRFAHPHTRTHARLHTRPPAQQHLCLHLARRCGLLLGPDCLRSGCT